MSTTAVNMADSSVANTTQTVWRGRDDTGKGVSRCKREAASDTEMQLQGEWHAEQAAAADRLRQRLSDKR